jgi:hypothetical protein
MRSLYDVYEMNACRCLSVRLSVRMMQLESSWTDVDEIWCERYAIEVQPKIVLLNFLQPVISTWRTNYLVRWDRH